MDFYNILKKRNIGFAPFPNSLQYMYNLPLTRHAAYEEWLWGMSKNERRLSHTSPLIGCDNEDYER